MSRWRWPFDIRPSAQSWTLVSRAAVSQSPLSGHTQTVSRGGSFWRCDLTFKNLDGLTRARLIAFLDLIADQAELVYMPDYAAENADSALDTASIITNGEILSATGWSSTDATLYLDDGWLCARCSHVSNVPKLHQEITSGNYAASGKYCLTANIRNDRAATSVVCKVGTTLGGSELALKSSLNNTGWDPVYFDAPSSGSIYITYEGTQAGFEGIFWVSSVVCTPTLELDLVGGYGTASTVRVKGLDPFTTSAELALKAGERVAIDTQGSNGELECKRLTTGLRPLFATGSDEAHLHIQPPMRASIATADKVLLGHNACGRMRLGSPGYTHSDNPGIYSDITVALVEAF